MQTVLTPALVSQVDAFLATAESGNLVKSMRDLMSLLTSEGVVVPMRLKPGLVGVHPENRNGCGVNPGNCLQLLSNVYDVGFSYDEIRAVAVEATPECIDFNRKLVEASSGVLPAFDGGLRFVSLSASHTNQALRCLAASTSHSDERLTIDGRLSMEKVGRHDQLLHEAAREGLVWQLYHL